MKVFIENDFFGDFINQTEAEEILKISEIPIDTVRFEARPNEARRLCAIHITHHYPEWKQLNILRSGDKDELTRMSIFIDSCRAWSNEDKPSPVTLRLITP